MNAPGLFWASLRMGSFAFGGGPSMIPLMKTECVGNGFVSEDQFVEALAVANALPGPIATKMVVWVGWAHGGVAGASIALFGLLLPSTATMLLLLGFLSRHREHPLVKGALEGAKPAIVGMLFYTAVELAPGGVKSVGGVAVALGAFAALLLEVHPAIVIAAAMGVGAALLR